MVRVISSEDPEIPYRRRSVRGVRIFVNESAVDVMIQAADESLLDDCETLGLMIGRVYRDEEGEYVTVDRAVSSELVADSSAVEFDKDDMEELICEVDSMKEDERIVGWYHSHLGIGCYMSEVDVRTQHAVFGKGAGFAVVIDPVKGELAVFDNSEIPEKVQMIICE